MGRMLVGSLLPSLCQRRCLLSGPAFCRSWGLFFFLFSLLFPHYSFYTQGALGNTASSSSRAGWNHVAPTWPPAPRQSPAGPRAQLCVLCDAFCTLSSPRAGCAGEPQRRAEGRWEPQGEQRYLLQHYCLLLLQEGLELGRGQDLLHLLWCDHLWGHHGHGHGDLWKGGTHMSPCCWSQPSPYADSPHAPIPNPPPTTSSVSPISTSHLGMPSGTRSGTLGSP